MNVEATPALGYYHDRAVDESLRRTISRSSTATFVNNWHNVRSPTIDNWHGCDLGDLFKYRWYRCLTFTVRIRSLVLSRLSSCIVRP